MRGVESVLNSRFPRWFAALCAVILGLCFFVQSAQCFIIDTGDPDWQVSFDNTVKFSTMYRLMNPSSTLTSDFNLDDGDRAFKSGFTSARFDLLTELDIRHLNYGIRVSAAGWYDPLYWHATNDNNSPGTFNGFSVPNNSFPYDTERDLGLNEELLDAFAYGSNDCADGSKLSWRVGQFAQIWGESLFFGNNGIANGMAPVDVIKLLQVPNSQFNEIIRPVPQAGLQWQPSAGLSFSTYYQFGWKQTRIPPADSYFSDIDFVGDGAERLFAAPNPFNPGNPFAFYRAADMDASDQGQGGIDARFQLGQYDFGLYAIRYSEKLPQLYLYPAAGLPNFATGQIGTYREVYPEEIEAFGASASTTFGICNLAGELSFRYHTPLVSDAVVLATPQEQAAANNTNNPYYAVGNSLHGQISTLTSFSQNFIAKESTLLGEMAWNCRLQTTSDPLHVLDPNTTRNALGLRMVYEPVYRQVRPGVDLSFPVGVGYFPVGTSSVIPNFGPDNGGDFNIGIKATYLEVWHFALVYTMFFGNQGPVLTNTAAPPVNFTFDQTLADRDYVAFSVYRKF